MCKVVVNLEQLAVTNKDEYIYNVYNNNTNICNVHSVSKHTESDKQAVAR